MDQPKIIFRPLRAQEMIDFKFEIRKKKNHKKKTFLNAIIFQNMSPKLPQGSLFHIFMLLGVPGDASMNILGSKSIAARCMS